MLDPPGRLRVTRVFIEIHAKRAGRPRGLIARVRFGRTCRAVGGA